MALRIALVSISLILLGFIAVSFGNPLLALGVYERVHMKFLQPIVLSITNNPEGEYKLAMDLINTKDIDAGKTGVEWLQKSVDQNYPKAQYDMALLYIYGLIVKKDVIRGEKLVELAANGGERRAMQSKSGRSPAAREYNIAYAYLKGDGAPQSEREAFSWFLKSAEHNNEEAICLMGRIFKYGTGTTINMNESAQWYIKCAELGKAYAQNIVGYNYEMGLGVGQDEAKAFSYYRRAAEQNDSFGLKQVARMLKYGVGVPQDIIKAQAIEKLAEKLETDKTAFSAQ